MATQNFKNHSRMVPGFHYGLYSILILSLIASIWNLVRATEHHWGRLVALVVVGLTVGAILLAWYTREFALKVQDRAIRAEESLRYFALTQKLPDSRLTISQLIALRFASDTEFVLLVEKAVKENMSASYIKKAIVNWKPDEHRA